MWNRSAVHFIVCVCLKQCAYHQKNMQQYNRIIEQQKSIKCFCVCLLFSFYCYALANRPTHCIVPLYLLWRTNVCVLKRMIFWTMSVCVCTVLVHEFYSFLLCYYYISTKIMWIIWKFWNSIFSSSDWS